MDDNLKVFFPALTEITDDHTKTVVADITAGIKLLDKEDREYLLDKIEEARWVTGPTYNKGVHILMNVIEHAITASYDSPNRSF